MPLFLLLLVVPNEVLPALSLEETRHAVLQLEVASEEDHAEEVEAQQSEEVLLEDLEVPEEREEVLLLALLLVGVLHEVPPLLQQEAEAQGCRIQEDKGQRQEDKEDLKHQHKPNLNPSLLRLEKRNLLSQRFTVPARRLVGERETTPTHAQSTQRCQTLVILTKNNPNPNTFFSLSFS